MFEKEIYKIMQEIASLNGNEMIPTLTIYNMSSQLFKEIKQEDVSKEFHNTINELAKRGDIYCPRHNYWKVTRKVDQKIDYNLTYEKEEMLGVSDMAKTKKTIDQKLEDIFTQLLSGVKTDETELTELENLNDRVSKLENALLELAHYPCSNEFNRDDVYLALRKAGIIRGDKCE